MILPCVLHLIFSLIYTPSPRPHLRRRGHPQRRGEADGGIRSDGGECPRFDGAGGRQRRLTVRGARELRNAGLAVLVRQVLGAEVLKPRRVTMSKWDNEYIYPNQVLYACIDAFVCLYGLPFVTTSFIIVHHAFVVHAVSKEHVLNASPDLRIRPFLQVGNYLRFYDAIRHAYPDIKFISNCDGSTQQLDHPAHFYDYHIYSDANTVFSLAYKFDHASRSGFCEYVLTGKDAGTGSLLAALAEVGFLIGLERNRATDVVAMLVSLRGRGLELRRRHHDVILYSSPVFVVISHLFINLSSHFFVARTHPRGCLEFRRCIHDVILYPTPAFIVKLY
ncbi:hypothetical protein RHSIM_Rhsim04G0118300 [Rhododendron simsii]|uniref:3'-5' exonuclease domain-containing protein n=1 Tax=Rhododendron simsii TaxID=118357 RepID=A0A834H2Z3_RHOSS|nr:hypothetical protein RHSIM_Rhsim04G0118300 [Rhododendron simsii]